MKRILTLSTLYPNAEMPRFGAFVARQMEALAARGDWEVTLINPIGVPPVPFGHYKPLAEAAVTGVEGGITVHRPRFTLVPALSAPINPWLIARAVLPLARRLHSLAPFDLMDAQFFYPDGPVAERIARGFRIPLSVKARGADISHWGERGYSRRKMLAAANHASGLLAVSEALADDMAQLGFPREKIMVHYTGLDRELFRPLGRAHGRKRLERDFGVPATGPLIATVGALIPRKGQRFVIHALAQLPATHLALAGNGPDRAMLEQLAGELRLGDRVHILGSLDHSALPLLLSAADAMVMPSASEGLANAWVEALACGTPLVVTDAGGARELMTGPEAGRIVERNADAIAAGVREVLAAGYEPMEVARCAARFSWEANAAALADYYESLTRPPDKTA